jgi:hypothetical protein
MSDKTPQAAFVDYGRLLERDPNYGLPVNCYVCDAPHKALGFARIQDKSGTTHVPLCERCFRAVEDTRGSHTQHTILRKFFNAPDLEISEGGEATTEQLLALAEKKDKTEH